MSFGCPICNAFSEMKEVCPNCGQTLTDHGRYSDYFGDYSPYRPIEDLKLSDGIVDNAKNHECVHITQCVHCGCNQLIPVQEVRIID